jgi:hypothetical protein
MMRQCNSVDMTRRSPSYEVRLAKYAERCYEVYVPTLNREKVDPTVHLFCFNIPSNQLNIIWPDIRTEHPQNQRLGSTSGF